jgi:hypothetical protein
MISIAIGIVLPSKCEAVIQDMKFIDSKSAFRMRNTSLAQVIKRQKKKD